MATLVSLLTKAVPGVNVLTSTLVTLAKFALTKIGGVIAPWASRFVLAGLTLNDINAPALVTMLFGPAAAATATSKSDMAPRQMRNSSKEPTKFGSAAKAD